LVVADNTLMFWPATVTNRPPIGLSRVDRRPGRLPVQATRASKVVVSATSAPFSL
jgi:hypothetical protein